MMANSMHGPHCQGKFMHCECNECHGRPEPALNSAPESKEECGHHCIGHYCNELISMPPVGDLDEPQQVPCNGRLSENSRNHCRCKNCHNIPDLILNRRDPTISFSEYSGRKD